MDIANGGVVLNVKLSKVVALLFEKRPHPSIQQSAC
jgi:hypothetical protein